MGKLAVLGVGGHAKAVADAAMSSSEYSDVVFFADGDPLGCVAGDTKELIANHTQFSSAVIAIGDNKVREQKYLAMRNAGVQFATVVHPTAVIAASATIGDGTVVLARAVVNPEAKVDSNCILNTACIVEHDCVISSGVHVCPGVTLGGGVSIGSRSWIGIGATVMHGVYIGTDVTVGAGAVVVSNIQDVGIYVGCPAKQI